MPSLWHMSAVATTRYLDSAVLELTPAAVASGWYQEADIIDALESLQVDVDRLAVSRMFLATHPNEDVQTLQDRDTFVAFTQDLERKLYRVGPNCETWPNNFTEIVIRALNLARNLGQPCTIFVHILVDENGVSKNDFMALA